VGATKNPKYKPAVQAMSARTPNQNASFPARGKKLCGEEYLNQFTAAPRLGSLNSHLY